MKILRRLRPVLVASWALLPAYATAAPSFLGPSGSMFTPDATVLPRGCANAGLHHFESDEITRGSGKTEHPDATVIKVNYGLFDRLEVGLAFVDQHEVSGDNFLLNAKLAILTEHNTRHFNLVAGVIDAADRVDRTPYVYAAASIGPTLQRLPLINRMLPRSARLGAGWATGMIEGLFVNASVPVMPNVEFLWEWLENDFPGFFKGRYHNIGGRFRTGRAKGLAIDLGTLDFDTLAFGLSYTRCWGGKKGHHEADAAALEASRFVAMRRGTGFFRSLP